MLAQKVINTSSPVNEKVSQMTGQFSSIAANKLAPESQSNGSAVEVLGRIYELLVNAHELKQVQSELDRNLLEMRNLEEEKRNQEIIKVLTGNARKSVKQKNKEVKVSQSTKTEPVKVEKTQPTKTEPVKVEKTKTDKPIKQEKIEKKKPTYSPQTSSGASGPPNPVPTAESVNTTPIIPTPAPIVGAAAAGLVGSSLAREIGAKISSHESAGNSEKSYNIMNRAGTEDKKWDKYKLTDMTIGEVLKLAEDRRMEFNPKGENGKPKGSVGVAMGKYQFMPSTLRNGLAQEVFGPNWINEPFSGDNQERLHDIFFKNDVVALKSKGVPISEATMYMAHFLGPTGAYELYYAPDNVKMSSVMTKLQAGSNKEIAKLTVGEYKQRISTTTKNKTGLSFEEINQKRLNDFLQQKKYDNVQSNIGQQLNNSSQENADMKKELQQADNNAQVNVNNSILPAGGSTTSGKRKFDDRSAMQRKSQEK